MSNQKNQLTEQKIKTKTPLDEQIKVAHEVLWVVCAFLVFVAVIPLINKALRPPVAPPKVERLVQPFIIIDPEYPHSFKYTDGRRFFPMGDTAYCLTDESEADISAYFASRREHGFNFVRVVAFCGDSWPFGGTETNPDFTTINQDVYDNLDFIFEEAAATTPVINIELILWFHDDDTANWDEDINVQYDWVDNLTQRYRNRPNLFMWTVTNEFERYPDNVDYTYDEGDVNWAKQIASRIKSYDLIHAIGVHPSVWIQYYNGGHVHSICDPCRYPEKNGTESVAPQVVWPLWENSDVSLYITQNNEGVHHQSWFSDDPPGNCNGVPDWYGNCYDPVTWPFDGGTYYPVSYGSEGWIFEGAGLEDSVAEDWWHEDSSFQVKPVLDTEFGYQYEPRCEGTFQCQSHQAHDPDSVRKKAWKIATAGGYFAAGFTSSVLISHTEVLDNVHINNWRPEQFEYLYDFFTTKTEYWKMAPHLELVADRNVLLALPGVEYVAYFLQGTTNYINLEAGTYSVEWLNPRTGDYQDDGTITSSGGDYNFTSPSNEDWVLHLKASGLDITLDGNSSVPQGEIYTLTTEVQNNTQDYQTVDLWYSLTLPSGAERPNPLGPFLNIELAPLETRVRNDQFQVDNPLGTYTFLANLGDYTNQTILDSSTLTVEVTEPENPYNPQFREDLEFTIVGSEQTMRFSSLAPYDGWVGNTGEVRATDTNMRLQYVIAKSFVSFDTASLPDNAQIVSAKVNAYAFFEFGDPTGLAHTDYHLYGTLTSDDFSAPATVADISTTQINGINNWYTFDVTSQVNKTGLSQYRFWTNENNLGILLYTQEYSNATFRPYLEVTYR